MKTHDEMVQEWRQDPAFAAEYDAPADEFTRFDELRLARIHAGLTQAEGTGRMATQRLLVTDLEAGDVRQKHSPGRDTR